MAVPPTLQEVRERLGLPGAAVNDEELTDVLDAEVANQAAVCRTAPEYSPSLRQAVFRRCARSLAAKGVPLGILADEFGSTTLHATDAEISRLESPWIRFQIGTRSA